MDDYFASEDAQESGINIETQDASNNFDAGFVDVEAGDKQNQTTQKADTSNYDPIAEYEMYKNMMEACENCGMIFISHRLSSAVMADRIYMLENGEVIHCERITQEKLEEKK